MSRQRTKVAKNLFFLPHVTKTCILIFWKKSNKKGESIYKDLFSSCLWPKRTSWPWLSLSLNSQSPPLNIPPLRSTHTGRMIPPSPQQWKWSQNNTKHHHIQEGWSPQQLRWWQMITKHTEHTHIVFSTITVIKCTQVLCTQIISPSSIQLLRQRAPMHAFECHTYVRSCVCK